MTNGNDSINPTSNSQSGTGLTKREYFAGLAMQALIGLLHGKSTAGIKALPGAAVEFADVLVKALNEPIKAPEDINLKN